MFTAALVIGGMGLINFFDRIDLAPLMRWALIGVGGFAVALAVTQALRGDSGARLVLPGVLMAAAAPVIGMLGAEGSALVAFASHGLFTFGVLAASIVALTETGVSQALERTAADFGLRTSHDSAPRHRESKSTRERNEIVLDSQIARVLDYSGVGIWDWSHNAIDQTDSLPQLLGADSNAPFTPEALRNFIHPEDVARFDSELLTPVDGPFDFSIRLFDGRLIRLRGARAANEENGEIERLVTFVEQVSAGNGVNNARLRSASEAAIVPASADAMASKLSAALGNGDIVAAFQPIVSLENEKIAGYEALARWRGQDAGVEEGPERFVRAAERIGQGGVLAATMLDQAAAFLADALKKEKRKDLFVAMNVSWGQIREEKFLEAVRAAISKYDLPKKSLVLELTEADAVSDSALAGDVFRKLKNSGVALAFDDFGAGFTCLSNLRKYDFDYLKIDKSFTSDLESGGDGAKIVGSLAGLGKDLGLKVIVEGIESKSASSKARHFGCAYGQGYAFGKPVVVEPPKVEAAPEAAMAEDPAETAQMADEANIDHSGRELVEADAPAIAHDASEAPSSRKLEVSFSGGDDEPKARGWRLWRGERDLR